MLEREGMVEEMVRRMDEDVDAGKVEEMEMVMTEEGDEKLECVSGVKKYAELEELFEEIYAEVEYIME